MRSRNSAALIVLGWYLMVGPPRIDQGAAVGVDLLAPVSQWVNVHSFETADQCEAYTPTYRNQVATSGHSTAYETAIAASGPSLQCVASDDPRLKGN
jgi:hypothetical protein